MGNTSLDDFIGGSEDDEREETEPEEAEIDTEETGAEAAEPAETEAEKSAPGESAAVDESTSVDAEPEAAEPNVGADAEDEIEAVDPALSTYDFTPGGAPCAACGDPAEKRWRDEPGLVCPDCKEW